MNIDKESLLEAAVMMAQVFPEADVEEALVWILKHYEHPR
jgi:hypothetical protein